MSLNKIFPVCFTIVIRITWTLFCCSTRQEHVILSNDKTGLRAKQTSSVPFPFTSVADFEARLHFTRQLWAKRYTDVWNPNFSEFGFQTVQISDAGNITRVWFQTSRTITRAWIWDTPYHSYLSTLWDQRLSEIWTLISVLIFKVQIFRHKNVSENWTFSSDFRQYLKSKLFGNQTVIECLKSIRVIVLDTNCSIF